MSTGLTLVPVGLPRQKTQHLGTENFERICVVSPMSCLDFIFNLYLYLPSSQSTSLVMKYFILPLLFTFLSFPRSQMLF